MKNDPRAVKAAWTVWGIFIAAYVVMNWYFLKSGTLPVEKMVPGFGIAMPILSNLVWWAVGFRLRFRISHWWAFGVLTSIIVGIAGFVTMWSVAKSAMIDQVSTRASAQRIPSSAALTMPPANPAPSPQGNKFVTSG